MRLSTKVRYGTRLLIDVAMHEKHGPVALTDVARRQEVSLHYLRQLIGPLVSADIVRTDRGSAGGVRLARPAGDISLSLVVKALQGSTAPVACVDDPSLCSRHTGCITRGVWCRVQNAVDDVLSGTTIADLVHQQPTCDSPDSR